MERPLEIESKDQKKRTTRKKGKCSAARVMFPAASLRALAACCLAAALMARSENPRSEAGARPNCTFTFTTFKFIFAPLRLRVRTSSESGWVETRALRFACTSLELVGIGPSSSSTALFVDDVAGFDSGVQSRDAKKKLRDTRTTCILFLYFNRELWIHVVLWTLLKYSGNKKQCNVWTGLGDGLFSDMGARAQGWSLLILLLFLVLS